VSFIPGRGVAAVATMIVAGTLIAGCGSASPSNSAATKSTQGVAGKTVADKAALAQDALPREDKASAAKDAPGKSAKVKTTTSDKAAKVAAPVKADKAGKTKIMASKADASHSKKAQSHSGAKLR
jgi:hypothetical protein